MDNKKPNVFDYLTWRGDVTFGQSEFNEIDALIFSIFSYLDFSFLKSNETITIVRAYGYLLALPEKIRFNGPSFIMKPAVELFGKAIKTNRFKQIKVTSYVNIMDEEKEIQFAAVTFLLPDNTAVAAFRGTDTSLVGWKEDLNMCFVSGIPSQIEAAKYATALMERYHIPFRLVGHSKGGNLAIWAATHLPSKQKEHVIAIYSNDAPGFNDDFLASDMYLEIRKKIYSFVPESSIVGVLMSYDDFITISSCATSVFQHDPFSWLVQGNSFIYDNSRTLSSRQMERVINSWIKSMSPTEREALIESVFDLLGSSNAKTLEDLDKRKIKALFSMQKTFRDMGIKKQVQLVMSLSKVIFNKDTLVNSNPLTLLFDNNVMNNDDYKLTIT